MTMTVSEAGRLGGLATSHRKGHKFFVKIGKKGQKVTRKRYPGMASIWGAMGGRPRKPTLAEIEGEVE
jgi:hypothetical protein